MSLWMFQLRQCPVNTNRPLLRMYNFFSIFVRLQIVIRARGTGIDVPVWVEREVTRHFSPLKFLDVVRDINPFHPNISMHILNTVLHTSTKVQTRRICLTIKSFLSW